MRKPARFILALLWAGCLLATVLPEEKAWVGKRGNFWSFRPVRRPEVPKVRSAWVRTPVDAFILQRLANKGLTPNPDLDRRQWIRRATLDLTGMPPAPEEVAAFLRDRKPGAHERVVDRLMSTQAYAERWALRWLDVVRYADTNGFELDAERTQAWRYRDYVIRSFQQNKPYDRFVQEQIAGDEMFPQDPDALVATGFLRAGPQHVVGGNQDEELNRQEVLNEMTEGVASAFLGLTVHCARCHNHKFDPILQSDFYRLQAVFAATEGKEVSLANPEQLQTAKELLEAHKVKLKPIQDQISKIERPYEERINEEKKKTLPPNLLQVLQIPPQLRSEEQKAEAKNAWRQIDASWDEVLAIMSPEDKLRRSALRRQMHDLDFFAPDPSPAAFAVANMSTAPDTWMLKVGDHRHKIRVVPPGLPFVVAGDLEFPSGPSGRRTALARWLTQKDHPLTARVMVNRIWQLRLGQGLVATPNDFGKLGARPTHPDLLDWLSAEFTESGWNIRHIDRLIVLSSVYRQSSDVSEDKRIRDPGNQLYSRMNRRRLEGEAIRDSVLSVAGNLNSRFGGKPVRVPIEPEVYETIFTEFEADNLWPLHPDKREHARRSIYLLNNRTVRLPMLANLDQPDTMSSCAVRPVSTHGLQALNMMNSAFMNDQAEVFALRLRRDAGPNLKNQVRRAFELALSRLPRPEEIRLAERFLDAGGPLADFCLALLNRNEFVYVP